MILQALVAYYEALAKRGDIAQPGWCREKVAFALNISLKGELLGVIPQIHEEARGKKTVQVPDSMIVPERTVKAGKVVRSNFLCENIGYLLGFDFKGNRERAIEYFEACKMLHLELLKNTPGAVANAIRAYFQNWQPEVAEEHPIVKPYLESMATANIIFLVDMQYANEDDDVRQAWQDHYDQDVDAPALRCLVTGRVAPVSRIHGKIKGMGSQAAGLSLVSFNEYAYESYGNVKAQGLNAPIGKHAAFAYVTALNHLLADREHRRQIGDAMVVYWSEQADPHAQQAFSLLAFPEPDDDSKLVGIMDNLSRGIPIDDVDMEGRLCVLGLSPNAARVSVRFFLQDTFGAMVDHLRQHYERLDITRPSFDNRHYLSPTALLWETVNPNSRDKSSSPLLSGAVMRAILTGSAYPQALLAAVLTRIRSESKVSRGRAAIIKAMLIHNHHEKEVTTVALNESTNNRAYVLGRLFAVLEEAQEKASPNINTTIKDRYFTSACSTPGSVFPQLLKLSNHHTAKAEYGKSLEIRKAQLLDKLEITDNPLPAHHTLPEQGIFILGYYHQVQARYTKKIKED